MESALQSRNVNYTPTSKSCARHMTGSAEIGIGDPASLMEERM